MADWETNPDSLIGERITVLWAKGKRYEGTVSGFSSSTGRHIVTYDDGEVKEYNMGTKTFWLADGTEFRPAPTQPAATQAWQNTNAAGAGGGAYGGGANTYGTGTTTYGAGAYGSDAYSYTRWTPYVTKTPGAETEVAFHLFADSRAVRAGERVLLAGSPAALTDWGDGVPMQQDDRDPNLWHATVALPFAMSDYSKNGIFQFNYFIVTANGEQIREGPPVKSEERLRRHLYHTFRSNYREPRFRGWVAVAGKATLQRFARALFAEYDAGAAGAAQLVARFTDLAECTVGANRSHLEEVVEALVKEREVVPTDLLMAICGMMGYFGRTSEEKVYAAGGGGAAANWSSSYYYGAGAGGAGGKMVNRTPPRPGRWCRALLAQMDLEEWLGFPLKEAFGVWHFAKVAEGVGEAVERFAEEGDFVWLRAWPFLDKYGVEPTIPDRSTKGAITKFAESADELAALAQDALRRGARDRERLEAAAAARRAARAAAAGGGGGGAAGGGGELIGLAALELEEEAIEDPPALVAGHGWLRALVLHAPALTTLAALCEGALGRHLGALLPAVARKVEDFYFTEARELETLLGMLLAAPVLQDLGVAVALLRNKEADDFVEQTMAVVQCAVASNFTKEQERLAQEEGGAGEAKGAAPPSPADGPQGGPTVPLEGPWLDLMSAAKAWLFRQHGEEPALQKQAARADAAAAEGAGAGGWFTYNGKRYQRSGAAAAPQRPSEKKLLEQRAARLADAAAAADALLRLGFFAQHPRGLTFELSRCWFAHGDPSHVLAALCRLGAEGRGGGGGAGVAAAAAEAGFGYHPALDTHLLQASRKAVVGCEASRALAVVAGELPPAHPLGHRLLHWLALAAAFPHDPQGEGGRPPLGRLLARADLWSKLADRAAAGRAAGPGSPLQGIIAEATNLLLTTQEAIAQETVNLRTLHTVMDEKEAFISLLSDFGVADGSVNMSTLGEILDKLKQFDLTLEWAQCYAGFFCGCGVSINSAAVKQRIERLRGGYSDLTFAETGPAFAGVEALPFLGWLFQLRSSELFLQIWRRTGNDFILEQVEGAKKALTEEAAAAEAAAAAAGSGGGGPGGAAAAEAPLTEEQLAALSEEERIQHLEARAERERQRQAEEFERRDRLEQLLREVEDYTLQQAEVVAQVLPRARAAWESLAAAAVDGSLPVSQLGQSFGALAAEGQLKEELRCLLSTARGTRDGYQAVWARTLATLEDYRVLKDAMGWVPSLLRLHNGLAELCETPPRLDPFHQQLKAALASVDRAWGDLTLGGAAEVAAPLRATFQAYTREQLAFLAALGGAECALLPWLLRQSSTEEFNRLLQVVRPCTDEPRLLSSIASLVHVRTMLLGPLYSDPPYANFRAFLETFVEVDLAGDGNETGMWHLQNILGSFDGLMDVFEKQTRSPGIKSCYDLKEVFEKGTFVVAAAPSAAEALSLELRSAPPPAAAGEGAAEGKDGGGGGEAAAGRVKVERLDYLLDLRSKLLMTEIPPELEEEMGASALVEAFVAQLEVVTALAEAAAGLLAGGHVGFQAGAYARRFPVARGGLPALKEELAVLHQTAAKWAASVTAARDAHYFLNYFTVREVLRMRDLALLLREQEEGKGGGGKNEEGAPSWEPVTEVVPLAGTGQEATAPSPPAPAPAAAPATRQYKVVAPGKGIVLRQSPDLVSELVADGKIATGALVTVGPPKPEHADHRLVRSGRRLHVIFPVDGYVSKHTDNGTVLLEELADGAAAAGGGGGAPPPLAPAAAPLPAPGEGGEGGGAAHGAAAEEEPSVEQMMQMGFAREWAEVALARCDGRVDEAVDFCFANAQFMDRVVEEFRQSQRERQGGGGGGGGGGGEGVDAAGGGGGEVGQEEEEEEERPPPAEEFRALLRCAASRVAPAAAAAALGQLATKLAAGEPLLEALGEVLAGVFGQGEEACAREVARANRAVPPPDAQASNRADLLVRVDDGTGESKLPLFVTAADAPNLVLDTVLSVYVRRGRLPEPGEVLFATAGTSAEDLDLLVRRFLDAKPHGRGHFVWCLADAHNLGYAAQCGFADALRRRLAQRGPDRAATLLVVSGRPRQVLLNALSAHRTDLPPLAEGELRRALAHAFAAHCGETRAVYSEINGGGKTAHIRRQVAARQRAGEPLVYRRVPLRESTGPAQLVAALRRAHSPRLQPPRLAPGEAWRRAFHVDVAHVVPAAANVLLFQLLVVGALRDPRACRAYARDAADAAFVEIPNSVGNKTAQALRFAALLPAELLVVSRDRLRLDVPEFTDALGTQISCPEYTELVAVCKYLRAFKAGKFDSRSGAFQADFSTLTDEPITPGACFDLLAETCCAPDGPSPRPSWALFRGFALFMAQQFQFVDSYPLLSGAVLSMTEGLGTFKQVFLRLLIETSKDFSLRSVAQVGGVGPDPAHSAHLAPGAVDPMGAPPAAPPMLGALGRTSSGRGHVSVSARFSQVREQATQGDIAPELVQEDRDLAARFQSLASWESSDHPVVLFKPDAHGQASGVDILSLNAQFLGRYIEGELKQGLEANFISFDRDWEKLTNAEAVRLLREVEGLTPSDRGGLQSLDRGYVLTVDNMLKMLSISLRLRFRLPVIIMGETGCGKSSLIRSMCGALGWPLHIMNVHGGITDGDVAEWTRHKVALARNLRGQREKIVVFYDEVNTTNCMGLFKEIVCDRCLDGEELPANLAIIAACNPYRLRTAKSLYGGEEMAGLVFEHAGGAGADENVGTGIRDPLRNLVYRVHPLPESMIDHIFDFGSLSSETEALYIKSMLRKQLGLFAEGEEEGDEEEEQQAMAAALRGGNRGGTVYQTRSQYRMTPFQEFVAVFAELICAAQECVRALSGGERSAVSLRDVARCVKVFAWFGNHLYQTRRAGADWELEDFFLARPRAEAAVRRAAVLALAYTYHARLPRDERAVLVGVVADKWRELQLRQADVRGAYNYMTGLGGMTGLDYLTAWRPPVAKCRWLRLEAKEFVAQLEGLQREVAGQMNLPEGIALNEALCENLFMILVSVLNQVPIFVIGKPGSSKSLAMGLVAANLNGDASEAPFLRALPAVEVFSYQCSPLSTSGGIEQAFETARRYKQEAGNTVVVVLLDEVGLAEQSPHLPLKVLHKVLDEAGAGEAVVGISNWALDPAKMNRAVHLYRPAPTVEDLSLTAEGMVRSANLKGYLSALARAYSAVYSSQEHADFWGLREFYSTVRAINSALKAGGGAGAGEGEGEGEGGEGATAAGALTGAILLNAVLRNFGGRPHEMERVVGVFFEELGLPVPTALWASTRVESLVRANLRQPEARHLMLLTKNNAALGLLFDRGLLRLGRTEVLFGSDFPLDQTDLQICLDIQRVKLCMAEGIAVVLVHGERLYESLYDLLNQHYCEYGGQLYVRLAFGTHSRLCPIHRDFRIVVVVEKVEAYTRLAPPLLNRFEKQVFEHRDVLEEASAARLRALAAFARDFVAGGGGGDGDEAGPGLMALRAAFCGYHSDLLGSLLSAVTAELEGRRAREEAAAAEDGGGGSPLSDPAVFEQVVLGECAVRLLWVASPEAVCRLLAAEGGARRRALARAHLAGDDPADLYFQRQRHASLPAFCARMLGEWSDGVGAQVVAMTYSPLAGEAAALLRERTQFTQVTHVVLHELDQERDLRAKVGDFFAAAAAAAAEGGGAEEEEGSAAADADGEDDGRPGSVLLIQCDPLAASLRRIEHARFVVENHRAKFAQARRAREEAAAAAAAAAAEGKEDDGGRRRRRRRRARGAAAAPAAGRGLDVLRQLRHAVAVRLRGRAPAGGGGGAARGGRDDRAHDARGGGRPGLRQGAAAHAAPGPGPFGLPGGAHERGPARADRRAAPGAGRGAVPAVRAAGRGRDAGAGGGRAARRGQRRPRGAGAAAGGHLPGGAAHPDPERRGLLLRGRPQPHGPRRRPRPQRRPGPSASPKRSNEVQKPQATNICTQKLILIQMKQLVRDLWYRLFHVSFWEMNVFAIAKAGAAARGRAAGGGGGLLGGGRLGDLEVATDGHRGQPFAARFPFAFYLAKVLESMRASAEAQGGGGGDALASQFDLLGLGLEALPPALLRRYAHDLCCARLHPVRGMGRGEQAALFWRLLALEEARANGGGGGGGESKGGGGGEGEGGGEEEGPGSLPALHRALWAAEEEVRLVMGLLDAVPGAQAPVAAYLRGGGGGGGGGEGAAAAARALGGETAARVVALTLAALAPEEQGWAELVDYSAWMEKVDKARPLVATLNGLAGPRPLAAANADAWERLEFAYAFLRDAAYPLRAPASETLRFLAALRPGGEGGGGGEGAEGGGWRSPAALGAVVAALARLNRSAMRHEAGEFLCPITLERMADPVRAADGQAYERAAIAAWFAAGHRTSPATNLPLASLTLTPDRRLRRAIREELQADLSLVLEHYVFDVLLAPGHRDRLAPTAPCCAGPPGAEGSEGGGGGEGEGFCLMDFLGAPGRVAAALGEGGALEARHLENVLPSAAGKAALLRELLRLGGPGQAQAVRARLAADLRAEARATGLADGRLAVYYGTVLEQAAESGEWSEEEEPVDREALFALTVPGAEEAEGALEAGLAAVARARRLLAAFAERLCAAEGAAAGAAAGAEVPGAAAVAALLAEEPAAAARGAAVRSLRVFLVKQLERRRGAAFARGALLRAPLAGQPWLRAWRDGGDTGFVRFLGTSVLPQDNPLREVPGFEALRGAVASYLADGDLPSLGTALDGAADALGARVALGAFCAALFHEAHLLAVVVGPEDALGRRLPPLRDWLLAGDGGGGGGGGAPHAGLRRLAPSAQERRVLALFAGADGGGASPASRLLALGPESGPEAVLRARAAAHLCAAALAAGGGGGGPAAAAAAAEAGAAADVPGGCAWLRRALLAPGELAGAYVPTMPEDLAKMAQTVMGGRWYNCPNGHPYYVDLCGRPTVVQQCAECGADIGGTDHNLLETNVDIGNVGTAYNQTTVLEDRSERNYCLRDAATEGADRHYSARALGPAAVQAVRLCLHAALCAGAAAAEMGGPGALAQWAQSVRPLLNTTFCNPSAEELPGYFVDHYHGNWTLLKALLNKSTDDTALALHLILLSAGGASPALEAQGAPNAPDGPAPAVPGGGALGTAEWRSAWEARCLRDHLFPVLAEAGLEERLAAAARRFGPAAAADGGGGDDAGGAFLAEVREKFEVEALPVAERRRALPALFGHRPPFSLEAFAQALGMLPQLRERHHLLASFLEREGELRALRHLPAVFKWTELLLKRYNRQLDRAEAREMTIGAAIDAQPQGEQSQWEQAFAGFQAAWNLSWRRVGMFGCLVLPREFVQLEMSRETPLSFCLPGEADEGICPLALIRYLVDQHNIFVQAVDERLLLARRSTHRADARTAAVSSRHMLPAHAVAYDLEGDFAPFLAGRCVAPAASGGGVRYDFAKAEDRLLHRHFADTPAVDLELRAFTFAREERLAGGLGPLRQKVAQAPLPPDTQDAIRRDVTTPAQAARCMEVLETAIGFLTTTGGSFVKRLDESAGEMMLHQYLRTVLLMEDTSALGSRAVAQQVQLRHLEALHGLLSGLTEADPFEGVDAKYRDDLPDGMAEILEKRAPLLELSTLLPLLKGFIVANLKEGTMDPESKAKDNVGWLDPGGDAYLMDLPWFADHWPDNLGTRHLVAAYRVLEGAEV